MTDVTVLRQNIRYTTTLETTSCGECGVPFAMPADLLRRAREDSDEWFWCPNGHKLHYSVDEAARLRDQLTAARAQLDRAKADAKFQRGQRQTAERSAAAYKGQATRLRKRIGHGVCPCCHRTFRQVSDHMNRMHPGWADSEVTVSQEGGSHGQDEA